MQLPTVTRVQNAISSNCRTRRDHKTTDFLLPFPYIEFTPYSNNLDRIITSTGACFRFKREFVQILARRLEYIHEIQQLQVPRFQICVRRRKCETVLIGKICALHFLSYGFAETDNRVPLLCLLFFQNVCGPVLAL